MRFERGISLRSSRFFDAYARCVLKYSIDSFTDSSNSSNVSVQARLANQISLKSFHQRSIGEFSQG